MTNRHPFTWIDIQVQKVAFWPLLVFALFLMIIQQVLGKPLITPAAPSGIVSFEFAGSLSAAREMLESWGPTGRVYAGLSLGTDYLFLVAYSIAISLGCVLASRHFLRRSGFLSAVGVVLAWASFGAAVLDSVENYALIQVLLGAEQSLWPMLARICAIPKFLIVGLGLLYILLGATTWLAARVLGREMRTDSSSAGASAPSTRDEAKHISLSRT
jgi:hypothetical protein